MEAERWQTLKRIFNEALELKASEQPSYIKRICREDRELQKEVLSLLEAYSTPGILDRRPDKLMESALAHHSATEMKGKHIGPYVIVDLLGHGGMGSVYLARRADGQFEQKVALKLLKAGFASENQTRRFLAERQILATLNHEHIARLYDGSITENGQPWFAMEYAEGRPITEYCNVNGLTINQRLKLFISVCEAVQYAHRRLVVHRDLKPGNILVTDEGIVKLLDFGIAKTLNQDQPLPGETPLTRTGLLPLTPAYASPEQVLGEPVTTASDIYQLGVILYELLCNCRPYEVSGKTPSEIERIICEKQPAYPSTSAAGKTSAADSSTPKISKTHKASPIQLQKQLRGDVDTIVMKAIRKEPDRRYESAEQLANDIRNFLDGRPVTAHPDTLAYRTGKFISRHAFGVTATFAILFSLILGAGIAFWQASIATRAAELATQESQRATAALAKSEQSFIRAESLYNFLMQLFWAADPNRPSDQLPDTEKLLALGAQQAMDEDLAQPAERLGMLNVIAEIYLRQSWTEEARPLIDEAVKLGRTHQQDWPQDLARALQLKADLNRQEGNINQAKSTLTEAEEVIEHSTDYWNMYANIRADRSYLERLDRNYHKAINLIEPIYKVIQDQKSPDLKLKINIINYLSGYYADTGQLQQADKLREEGIEITSIIEGTESLNYGINLLNSISIKYNLGQFDQAEDRARQALSIFNNISNEPNGVKSVAYGALAASRLYSGQFAEALSTLETASKSWTDALNKDPKSWTVPKIYEGLMLAQMQRWPEAEARLMQNRDLFDQGHYTMYHTVPGGILAEALCRSGRTEQGNSILAEPDLQSTKTNPVYHAQLLEARARCHLAAGDIHSAHQKIRKSLDIMRYPGRILERSERMLLLAEVLTRLDKMEEAAQQVSRAEQLFLDLNLSDHPSLKQVRNTKRKLITYQN